MSFYSAHPAVNNELLLQISILFNETFYINSDTKYRLFCIEKPLSFDAATSNLAAAAAAHQAEFRISNVDDSIELLFTGKIV